MKVIIFVMIALTTFAPYLKANSEVDKLGKSIKPILHGTAWEMSTDWRSITLIRRNCNFLNSVSLPTGPDDDKTWEKYSFITDYRITITFDTKLTDAEYQQQRELKQRFITERTRGLLDGTK
ncbi:MAG TPA: hypothetical protein DCZ94_20325 [Lentisphaeria bacterium]|nr:MAG: hypothetical protein A2X48_05910 [Lentisphaerae bacterium GWF2_49_21]HBC89294.1 hypothetical protein [Lentisphaeria bacterium]